MLSYSWALSVLEERAAQNVLKPGSLINRKKENSLNAHEVNMELRGRPKNRFVHFHTDLSAKDIADILGIKTLWYVKKWIRQSSFPYQYIGKIAQRQLDLSGVPTLPVVSDPRRQSASPCNTGTLCNGCTQGDSDAL